MITVEQLQVILPHNTNIHTLCATLNNLLPKYEINTKNRIAGFLGQCAVESVEFTKFEENLNYSSQSLMKVWPHYFLSSVLADQYARQPEKIANKVYANRMGNGDEHTGDGFKFRGRGFIQLTGHDNYSKCGHDIGKDLNNYPEYLETPEGALASALWFWNKNYLSDLADHDDILHITKKINGGTIGLDERTHLYQLAKQVLSV